MREEARQRETGDLVTASDDNGATSEAGCRWNFVRLGRNEGGLILSPDLASASSSLYVASLVATMRKDRARARGKSPQGFMDRKANLECGGGGVYTRGGGIRSCLRTEISLIGAAKKDLGPPRFIMSRYGK